MLDDLFQDGTDQVLMDRLRRPGPTPPPEPATSAWSAIPRGLGAAGAEMVGFLEGATSLQPDEGRPVSRLRQEEQQRFRDRYGGRTMEDLFRESARDLRPDARAASTADRLLFDFSRFAGKAVGYSAALGPLASSVLTGADEGTMAADDLRLQGVDLETRAKVGAVAGLAAAAGVALPVAGRTLTQTAALVAVGGPGAFMAQAQASRHILQNAGYDRIAGQFDPLDPVGLAVSTLVPLGFGAVAMRRARLRGAGGAENAGSAGRTGENQPQAVDLEGNRGADGAGAFPDELVDAARVQQLAEARQASNPADAADLRAAQRHDDALTRAEEQMAAGERVDVADLAPEPRRRAVDAPEFRAWFEGSRVVGDAGAPRVVYHGTTADIAEFTPGQQPNFEYGSPSDAGGFFFTSEPAAADYYAGRGQGANVMPVYLQIRNPKIFDSIPFDLAEQAEMLRQARAEGHDGARIGEDEWVAFEPSQIKSAIGNTRFDPGSSSLTDSPFGAWVERVGAAVAEMRAAAQRLETASQRTERPQAPKPDAQKPAAEAPEPQAGAPRAGAAGPAAEAGAAPVPDAGRAGDVQAAGLKPAAAEAAEARAADARLAEIEQEFPDLEVLMDGMEQPVRLSEFLADIRRQAEAETADAPLLEVAANCFLTNGA